MSVIQVTSDEDFIRLINDKKFETTIVDFTATWCGPCKHIKPIYEELAKNNPDIQFIQVDIDEQERIAANHSINSVPTFVVYQNGKLGLEKISGANQKSLTELVRKSKKNAIETVPEPDLDTNKTTSCTCVII